MSNDKIELIEREIEELREVLRWCNQTDEKLLRMIRMLADQVEGNSRNLKLLAEVCARKVLLDDGNAFSGTPPIN